MKKYKITLQGCDDCTYIPMELNEEEVQVIIKLSKRSKELSSYGCMPTLIIEEIEKEEYWDMITKEGF